MADKDKKNKKKKAKFQEGDYSDIKIKGIIDPVKVEVKDAEMPKVYKDPKIKYNMPKPYIENEGQYKSMESPKKKNTLQFLVIAKIYQNLNQAEEPVIKVVSLLRKWDVLSKVKVQF